MLTTFTHFITTRTDHAGRRVASTPSLNWGGWAKIIRAFAFLVFVLVVLSGCSTFPSKMVGQFEARRGDFILIEKDGAVYWSPPSKTGNQLSLVGIASPGTPEALVVPLTVPSTSPFLYSEFTFSADYSLLTVDWGRSAGEAATRRSTEYERQATK